MANPFAVVGVGLFWSSLLSLVGHLVYRVVVSLGVGWVTFTGISFLVDQLLSFAQSQVSSLDPAMFQIFALLRVDDAIAMLASAISIKFTLIGMTAAGSLRKSVWRAPPPQAIGNDLPA
jgi:hypothetical protein